METKKLSKEEYYMNIAREVARKSKCYRRMMGAIIVRDDQIISAGYIGAVRKGKDCYEHGFCLRTRLGIPHGQRYELCRSVHAEQNAIINAARSGVSLLSGDIYLYAEDEEGRVIDALPCFICKKIVINSGLSRMICSTADGKFRIFEVEAWVHDWQIRDIIEDKEQYGQGQKIVRESDLDKVSSKLNRQNDQNKKPNIYENQEINRRFDR
ncbi:MAG: deaminase [bacterium]|nr:deaminase [bacterium]